MDWKTYIRQFEKEGTETKFVFAGGASGEMLNELQEGLQLTELPEQFTELYHQSNGISEYLNNIEIGYITWPLERIIETNLSFRNSENFKELYMSFDQLVFFADAGNGDQFAYCALRGRFDRADIFVWDHETDSRKWVAPNLERFIEWWLTGVIEL